MTEPLVIVGARASDDGNVIPGGIMVPCKDCRQPTNVSPSSFEPLAEGADVICMWCFSLRAKREERIEIMRMTDDQKREIETWRRSRERG